MNVGISIRGSQWIVFYPLPPPLATFTKWPSTMVHWKHLQTSPLPMPHLIFWPFSWQLRQNLRFKPIVCRRFETPYYRKPPIWTSHLFIYFPTPLLLARLSWQYCPIEIPDKHKNKLTWQSYFFIFIELKNNVTCFFYKQLL